MRLAVVVAAVVAVLAGCERNQAQEDRVVETLHADDLFLLTEDDRVVVKARAIEDNKGSNLQIAVFFARELPTQTEWGKDPVIKVVPIEDRQDWEKLSPLSEGEFLAYYNSFPLRFTGNGGKDPSMQLIIVESNRLPEVISVQGTLLDSSMSAMTREEMPKTGLSYVVGSDTD